MEDWVVDAYCDPSDTVEAAAVAIAALAGSHGVHNLSLERLGSPPIRRRWDVLTARDAAAIVRAELEPNGFIDGSLGAALQSGRGLGVYFAARSAEYVKLQAANPLVISVNPCDLATPEQPSVGHIDFDGLVLSLVGSGTGEARVQRAFCRVEGGLVASVRDACAAYYARAADLAAELGIDVSGADLVAALELAAAEIPPHRRVNTHVSRVDDGGVLLSVTPFPQSRHTEKTLAPLMDGARQLLGC